MINFFSVMNFIFSRFTNYILYVRLPAAYLKLCIPVYSEANGVHPMPPGCAVVFSKHKDRGQLYTGTSSYSRFTKTYHTYGDIIDSSWFEVRQRTHCQNTLSKHCQNTVKTLSKHTVKTIGS